MSAGNMQSNIIQDSARLSANVLLSSDALRQGDSKVILTTIAESPKRLPKSQVEHLKSKEKFIPSISDSIEFNLINRVDEKEGVLSHSIVKDYLEPMKTGDKLWLKTGAEGVSDTLTVAYAHVMDSVSSESKENVLFLEGNDKQLALSDSLPQQSELVVVGVVDQVRKDSIVLVNEPVAVSTLLETRNFDKDVLLALLILSVAIAGFVRVASLKFLRELFEAIVFSANARKMQKTVNLRNLKPAFVLNGLFLLNGAIFAYEAIQYYNIATILHQSLLLIPVAMGILLSYGLIKNVLYRFVGYVFDVEDETSEYLFYNALHNKIFGLLILPIILVVPYIDPEVLPVLFKSGMGLFVFMYLIQIFRGVLIILKNVASLFYMFLYLCALEFLPLVILYKILIN